MAYCPECDATRELGSFCQECGTPLIAAAADQPEPADSAAVVDHPPTGEAIEDDTDYFAKGPLGFTFTYPIGDGWAPILITGLFSFLSWLVIPGILVYGYCYRLGRAAIRGDEKPPQYGDWVQLFIDGILLIVVVLPWALAMLIIGMIPLIAAIEFGSFALGLVGMLFLLIGGYVTGGVVATFLATGSVVQTYRGFRFLQFVRTGSYLKSIVLIIVANIIAWTVFAALAVALAITIIGILLVIPLYFVAIPFVTFIPYLLLGYYFREAADRDAVSQMDDEERISATF